MEGVDASGVGEAGGDGLVVTVGEGAGTRPSMLDLVPACTWAWVNCLLRTLLRPLKPTRAMNLTETWLAVCGG